MTFDNFAAWTADEQAALQAARGAARGWTRGEHRGLIFYAALQDVKRAFPGHGELHVTGCGCGKTHLAVSLAKVAITAGRTIQVTTEADLLRAIKRSYGDNGAPDEAAILAGLAGAWLLVLDDIGTEDVKSTGWYQGLLYAIVNQRYTSGRPLIMTTNLTPDGLAERLGTRTWSRLQAMAECFRLDGPDRREWR